MSDRFPRFTAAEIAKILHRNGFALISQKGSHQKFWNAETRITVIVPEHGSRPLPVGTIRQIVRTSGIPEVKCRG